MCRWGRQRKAQPRGSVQPFAREMLWFNEKPLDDPPRGFELRRVDLNH